jgi:hypothetical protein
MGGKGVFLGCIGGLYNGNSFLVKWLCRGHVCVRGVSNIGRDWVVV